MFIYSLIFNNQSVLWQLLSTFYQSGPTQGETLFVVEALLNCSSKSLKSADGDTPLPCGADEKGEMQVRFTT